MLSYILDYLFPPHCLLCGTQNTFLCPACLAKIPKRPSSFVEKDLYAPYSYQNKLTKKALRALKYKGAQDIANIFGEILHQELQFIAKGDEKILLIPIPTTRRSFLKRGFNQSELLARAILKQNPNRYILRKDVLTKKRGIKKQTDLKTKKERIKNMKDAYTVKESNFSDTPIVLIDDIITTGATMKVAQKILKRNGARKVIGLSVAYQELA